MCVRFFTVKQCICGLKPPACGSLQAISRCPTSFLPPLHLLPSHPLFPHLLAVSWITGPFRDLRRGQEGRGGAQSSEWTAPKFWEVHKGEDTAASIQFLKCGQAGKKWENSESNKNFLFCSGSKHKRLRSCSAVELKDRVEMRKLGLWSQTCGSPIRNWANYFNYWTSVSLPTKWLRYFPPSFWL